MLGVFKNLGETRPGAVTAESVTTMRGTAAPPTTAPPAETASTSSNSARKGPIINMGTANSQGHRDHMEDYFTMIKDFKTGNECTPSVFLALYDGHSSHRGSELASQRLHEILAEQPELQGEVHHHHQQQPTSEAIETALKSAFKATDDEIIDQAHQDSPYFKKTSGTTAVCALFLGLQMHIAHAGDSRAVLCRDDVAVKLTKDHKPASDPEERARIEALGGRISYKDDRVLSNRESGSVQTRLNMSRALGDEGHKVPRPLVTAEPSTHHMELIPGRDHFIVLGTDGLFEKMAAGDVCGSVRKTLKKGGGGGGVDDVQGDAAAGAAAEALVAEALRRGSKDNVTAAVALLQWS